MALEPITRQEQIIAGKDLEPITRMEKFLKQYGGGGGGGVGSADAVLYTKQTLTEAQKKQARENIGAEEQFAVNGTLNADQTVTLDKTFAQIQAAIQEGKQPVAKLLFPSSTFSLPLVNANDTTIVFCVAMQADDSSITFIFLALTSTGDVSIVIKDAAVIDDYGRMQQVKMKFNPISDMQIATKKYVDDKECILKSTTPGSTKKFKITVGDSGAISATEVTA